MLRAFGKWIDQRRQVKESERVAAQTEAYNSSPYAQLLASRQRLGDYLNNPENAQQVSKLQGELLEANGGLVVGGHHERQEGGLKTANKERG